MSHLSHRKEPGLLSRFVGMGFTWIGWMCLAWFLLLMVASISTIFISHEVVLRYTKQLLQQEIIYLDQPTVNTWFFYQPAHIAEHLTQTLQHVLWVKTHVMDGLEELKRQQDSSNELFRQAIRQGLPWLMDYVQLVIKITQITVIRLFIIVLVLPLFWVLGFVGWVDGLVEHTLRRLQGARESALIYHQARQAMMPSFIGGCFLYVILPLHLPALWLLLPCSLLFAFLLSITTRMFKKYV